MRNRTYTKDLSAKVGETITMAGWVDVRRDQGKMVFFDLRDMTGNVQCIVLPNHAEANALAKEIRPEWVLKLEGIVNKRPEKNINPNIPSGDVELKVQETIIDSFREFMKKNNFFEFQAPAITPATAEGGAEVFKIDYFDKKAYLTQSPQLYKQIVMSAFERCFSVNKVFRAEPSSTTRHLTEIVSLDAEMGFIDSWTDVRDMAEETVRFILQEVEKKNASHLKILNATLPTMIEKTPTISLAEAQQKIFDAFGRDVRGEKDLNAQDERELCEIIKKETDSDFVFVYGYPTRQKPFYVFPNPENPEFNEGMDLLCRGVEWLSGGRRVNEYTQLMDHVEKWNMDPSKVKMFLEAFKYGVPPEGGFAFGAERITMQLLGLKNVREASMFPRDMHRIDERLAEDGY